MPRYHTGSTKLTDGSKYQQEIVKTKMVIKKAMIDKQSNDQPTKDAWMKQTHVSVEGKRVAERGAARDAEKANSKCHSITETQTQGSRTDNIKSTKKRGQFHKVVIATSQSDEDTQK